MDSNVKARISNANPSNVRIPARWSLVASTLIIILISGILTCLVWFQVQTSHTVSDWAKVVFVMAGAVETFLFLASIPGFIGAIIRRRELVVAYASFLYAHFITNIAVTSVYIWMVGNTRDTDTITACLEGATDQKEANQCTGILRVTRGVFIGFGIAVLLLEFCGALSATYYAQQLRRLTAFSHGSRMQPTNSGVKLHSPLSRDVSTDPSESAIRLTAQPPTAGSTMLTGPAMRSNISFSSSFEFDPYREHSAIASSISPSRNPFDPVPSQQHFGRGGQTDIADQETKQIGGEQIAVERPDMHSEPPTSSRNVLPSQATSFVGAKPPIMKPSAALLEEAPPAAVLKVALDVNRPLPPRPVSVVDPRISVSLQPLPSDVNTQTRPIEVPFNPYIDPAINHGPVTAGRNISRPTSIVGGKTSHEPVVAMTSTPAIFS